MHGCEQLCVNKEGSFECECSRGFTLNSDGESCSRKLIRTCGPDRSVEIKMTDPRQGLALREGRGYLFLHLQFLES